MENLTRKAIEAVIKQGAPSMNEDGACLYRCGDLKCAVGHLIADEHYTPELEGSNLIDRDVVRALKASQGEITNKALEELKCVQMAHDGASTESFVPRFHYELKAFFPEDELKELFDASKS